MAERGGRAPLVWAAVSVLALGLAGTDRLPEKLVYNGSASAPKGFYWLDGGPPMRGDYVLVRVPQAVRTLVAERGYLPAEMPLIKRVVAMAGDKICHEGTRILINGRAVAMAKSADDLGRQLPRWRGCRRLDQGEIFLLQDHPDSFDGRYFGPVDRALVIARATRLRLLWGKAEEGQPNSRRDGGGEEGRRSGGQDKRNGCKPRPSACFHARFGCTAAMAPCAGSRPQASDPLGEFMVQG